MTPADTDPYSPNGEPSAYASLPCRIEAGLPSVAGTSAAGGCWARTTAMSCSGWVVTMSPADFEPSANVSSIDFAPSTTWRLVRMSPASVTTTPLPSPEPSSFGSLPLTPVVSMSTSDGWTAW